MRVYRKKGDTIAYIASVSDDGTPERLTKHQHEAADVDHATAVKIKLHCAKRPGFGEVYFEDIDGRPAYVASEVEVLRGQVEQLKAQLAAVELDRNRLLAVIGEPEPEDKPEPLAATWHQERARWRREISELKEQLAAMSAVLDGKKSKAK